MVISLDVNLWFILYQSNILIEELSLITKRTGLHWGVQVPYKLCLCPLFLTLFMTEAASWAEFWLVLQCAQLPCRKQIYYSIWLIIIIGLMELYEIPTGILSFPCRLSKSNESNFDEGRVCPFMGLSSICHLLWERFSGRKECCCGQDKGRAPNTAVQHLSHFWWHQVVLLRTTSCISLLLN